MATTSKRQSFLVEISNNGKNLTPGRLRLGRRVFDVAPLFRSDDATKSKTSKRATRWHTVTAKSQQEGQHPWDWAHELSEKLQAVSGEAVYVEPDLEQAFPYLNREGEKDVDKGPERTAESGVEASSDCSVNEPDSAWPMPPSFAWHLDDPYSQLASARDAVGDAASDVRICHLDTGVDPNHSTFPENVNLSLAWNFVENNNDARDPGKRGILYNPGHGTGTLGILSGNHIDVEHNHLHHKFNGFLGGCPHAEIVPVRVASSVVHLWTSSMAMGIVYAAAPVNSDKKERPCDVVTISMGGLPSRAWSAAVNRAYDAGVVVVAAAGNNFGGLPMRRLVWPARFKRVIAACGITAAHTPYFKSGLHFKMQGNFGPHPMTNALAAFTPNAPWAELGCSGTVDLDGAGTSSATPQIAAACALWIAKNRNKLGSGWRRVEAVRAALFAAADKSLPDGEKFYGNGVLKAKDALDVAPLKAKHLLELPEDDVRFPFLHRLDGWKELEPAKASMFEVEAAQLYASEIRLQDLYAELESGDTGSASQSEVIESFVDLPNISHSLRHFLIDR